MLYSTLPFVLVFLINFTLVCLIIKHLVQKKQRVAYSKYVEDGITPTDSSDTQLVYVLFSQFRPHDILFHLFINRVYVVINFLSEVIFIFPLF